MYEQRSRLPCTNALGRLSVRGVDDHEGQSSGTDSLSTYQSLCGGIRALGDQGPLSPPAAAARSQGGR